MVFIKPSYVCNSVAILLLLVLFIVLRILSTVSPPTERGFYCNDDSIRYPSSKQDTVPDWALLFISIGLPLAAIVSGSIYITIATSAGDAPLINLRLPRPHKSCLLKHILPPVKLFVWYIFALTILTTIIDFTRLYVGELRPEFFNTCDPDPTKLNCTSMDGFSLFVTQYTCRGDTSKIREARLSFPSGHAAYSTYACSFVILYISTFPLLTSRSPFQVLIMGVVTFLSIFVSASRIIDHKHHPHDVIAGMIMGGAAAVLVVFYNLRYFGGQSSRNSDVIRHHSDTTEEVSLLQSEKGSGYKSVAMTAKQ